MSDDSPNVIVYVVTLRTICDHRWSDHFMAVFGSKEAAQEYIRPRRPGGSDLVYDIWPIPVR